MLLLSLINYTEFIHLRPGEGHLFSFLREIAILNTKDQLQRVWEEQYDEQLAYPYSHGIKKKQLRRESTMLNILPTGSSGEASQVTY